MYVHDDQVNISFYHVYGKPTQKYMNIQEREKLELHNEQKVIRSIQVNMTFSKQIRKRSYFAKVRLSASYHSVLPWIADKKNIFFSHSVHQKISVTSKQALIGPTWRKTLSSVGPCLSKWNNLFCFYSCSLICAMDCCTRKTLRAERPKVWTGFGTSSSSPVLSRRRHSMKNGKDIFW